MSVIETNSLAIDKAKAEYRKKNAKLHNSDDKYDIIYC